MKNGLIWESALPHILCDRRQILPKQLQALLAKKADFARGDCRLYVTTIRFHNIILIVIYL